MISNPTIRRSLRLFRIHWVLALRDRIKMVLGGSGHPAIGAPAIADSNSSVVRQELQNIWTTSGFFLYRFWLTISSNQIELI